jgi:hypothetical protein
MRRRVEITLDRAELIEILVDSGAIEDLQGEDHEAVELYLVDKDGRALQYEKNEWRVQVCVESNRGLG